MRLIVGRAPHPSLPSQPPTPSGWRRGCLCRPLRPFQSWHVCTRLRSTATSDAASLHTISWLSVHADALVASRNSCPQLNCHVDCSLHSAARVGEACPPRPSLQQFRHAPTLLHPAHPVHPATLMLIIGVLVVIIASRVAIGCLRCATSIGLSGRASSPLERRETGIARPSLMRAVRLSVRAEGEGGLHLDAPLHRPRQSHDQHPRSSEPRLQRPRRSMQPSPKLVARLLDSNGVLGC